MEPGWNADWEDPDRGRLCKFLLREERRDVVFRRVQALEGQDGRRDERGVAGGLRGSVGMKKIMVHIPHYKDGTLSLSVYGKLVCRKGSV